MKENAKAVEYAYAVTCSLPDGSDVRVSGSCFHSFENAMKFVEERFDKPVKTRNPQIWKSEKHVYNIIPFTFGD